MVSASEGQTAALQMQFRVVAVREITCNTTDNGCKRTGACGVNRTENVRSMDQIKEQYVEKKVMPVHHTRIP